MEKGKFIIIFGESGSGKSKVADILSDKYKLNKCISCTSREIRPNEIDGVDYYFMTKDTVLSLYNNKHLLEIAEYDNNYYGLLTNEINTKDFAVMEPLGVYSVLKSNISLNNYIIPVYITASESVRTQRLSKRENNFDIVKSRIEQDNRRFSDKIYNSIEEEYRNNMKDIINPSILPEWKRNVIKIVTDNISTEDVAALVMYRINELF